MSNIQWRRNEFENGGIDPARSAGKFFLVVPLHFLAIKKAIKEQLVFLVSAFVMVSTVSFLFAVLLLTVPPCPAICKSGWHVAPVPHGVGATANM